MPDRSSSPLAEIAARLVGGDEGDTLREWADRFESGDVETAAGLGIAMGEAFNNRPRRRDASSAQDGPEVRLVEREDREGRLVAVRLLAEVRPPSAGLFTGDHAVLLRTPRGDVEVPLPFTPEAVEPRHEDDSAYSDWILRRPRSATEAVDAEFEEIEEPDDDD